MKSNNLLVLACLVSMPVFAQSLPDEINYGPYETRYRSLEKETAVAQAQLNQSRSSLAEAQKFISEMTDHVETLENKITGAQNEIFHLKQEIPELDRQISNLRNEDSRVTSEIRNRQSIESNLSSNYQQAQRDLRPLEDLLARKEQRLRELQADLDQHLRLRGQAESRLNRARSEAEKVDRQYNEQRNQLARLQEELRNIDSRVASIQSQISSQESSLSSLNNNLNMERGKLNALNGRVAENEAEVARLRSSGAPAADIAQAERNLAAVRSTRDNTASGIRNLESQVSQTEGRIRTLRGSIDDLRRNQTAIPGRISQTESRMRQLEAERGQIQGEINRSTSDVQNAQRNVDVREQQVASLRNDMRSDEQNVLRQRNLIENLSRQLDSVRSEITSLTQRSRNLNAEMARLADNIRRNQARIPQLEQEIREDQSEIAQGESDLVRARNDERTFTAAVARDEAKLSDLTTRRDTAQGEMNQRLSLYNHHLESAQDLGSGQAATGTTLGQKEGERLSIVLSKQNGIAVGRELGTAEAKYWGSVRGEIQGYDLGYSEGLASSEDMARATTDAGVKAAADAELFAQTNFKPVFFEEFVQDEFKKPLKLNSLMKSLKSMAVSFNIEEALESVGPLSPSELARSEELKTPLDQTITDMSKMVKTIEAKARRLSDPEVAFETPTKIPLGTVNCNQVYKGLAVFKAACEGSYKGAFANNYINAAHDSFAGIYQGQFKTEFNVANVSQREISFNDEFAGAQKVGRAEGLRIGKLEIYQRTFESAYKTAYVSELEKARIKAKVDALNELATFLKSNPLLTLAGSNLAAENFRGGEEVSLQGKVKNVGLVALNGPVIVRITELVNAEKITGEAVLNSAGALSVTDLPMLKVKVIPSAKAGEKMIVRGVVDLPGDLYKPARQEKFELVQSLTANPTHDLEFDFNKNPDIKGPFRRYVHFMSVTLSPKVEDIKEGYQLTLTPAPESAALVDMQDSSVQTGAMTVGSSKNVRFSYLFKDAARNKTVVFELAVTYAGKVIRKELLSVVPK